MSKARPRDQGGSGLRWFFYLAGVEILAAGGLTAFIAAGSGAATLTILGCAIAAAGGASLLIPRQLGRRPDVSHKILKGIRHPLAKFLPFAAVVVVSVLLFFSGKDLVWILSPCLIGAWLIGVEFLLFIPIENKKVEMGEINTRQGKWTILALIVAIMIALIPTRIASFLDGIPLDMPFEFVLLTILLPVAFIIGRRFLANKIVLWILALLLAVKIIVWILLPQAGLGVRAYSSEGALSDGNWEKSYGTFFAPTYTQVTQIPYHSYRELPIEWINRNGYSSDQLWVALELSGYAHLQKDERLVFLVEGAQQASLELVDASTDRAVPVVIVGNVKKIGPDLYQQLPAIQDSKLQGMLVFKSSGQYRVEPLILHPDGTTSSALGSSRLWISQDRVDTDLFQPLLDLVGLVLAGLLVMGLTRGLAELIHEDRINALDLYLGATGLLAYFVARLVPIPSMDIVLLFFVGALWLIKLLDHSISPRNLTWQEVLIAIGPCLLLIFLALDIGNLRQVVIFPQEQDGLEYQILARNIFVHGDVFLAQTPPRAYKVLFPYLVGLLHVVFGQSASAQFFLNAWCALLSSLLVLKLAQAFRLSAQLSLSASVLFLLILFPAPSYIYYFRFGLIEPVAITCLLATCYFMIVRNVALMFMAGMLTALFRLDYLGAILAAVLLASDPITGTATVAWSRFLSWARSRWKLIAAYALAVISPPLLIILGYIVFIPGYALSASGNAQTSAASILASMLIVIVGGDMADLHERFLKSPVGTLSIAVPVSLGFAIALVSLFYRRGVFQRMDLRLSLLVLGILPAYAAVRPTAYFPRYSWAPLPLGLIIIALLLQGLSASSPNKKIESWNQ